MMSHPDSHDRRLATLAKCLDDPSPMVRDGATLGFSYLDDLRAAEILEEAAAREPIPSLREDMLAAAAEIARGREHGVLP